MILMNQLRILLMGLALPLLATCKTRATEGSEVLGQRANHMWPVGTDVTLHVSTQNKSRNNVAVKIYKKTAKLCKGTSIWADTDTKGDTIIKVDGVAPEAKRYIKGNAEEILVGRLDAKSQRAVLCPKNEGFLTAGRGSCCGFAKNTLDGQGCYWFTRDADCTTGTDQAPYVEMD